MKKGFLVSVVVLLAACASAAGQEPWKPYSPPCVEREDVFAFAQKPGVELVSKDRYEITFAVKGNCDVTVGIIDRDGRVVRHLASGVLGANAPAPFQRDSLSQKLVWNGKDDLDSYPKNPEALKVRVSLGLKPVFDKRLGGTSSKNLPGRVSGITVGPRKVYVFCVGNGGPFGHGTIRTFDHDGKSLGTICPPPQGLPETKLAGMGYVEYEPGKRAVHSPSLGETICGNNTFFPPLKQEQGVGRSRQAVVIGEKLYFADAGSGRPGKNASYAVSRLHFIGSDGSVTVRGVNGIPFVKSAAHPSLRLAASPDGGKVYASNVFSGSGEFDAKAARKGQKKSCCVFAKSLDSDEPAAVFAGVPGKPGSDDAHFQNARGIACDSQGRVYVADYNNHRIQVFADDGKLLKSIKIDRPNLIYVHRKTGAIYVQHMARERGKSRVRLTKLESFDNPREEFHQDGFNGALALDSWTPRSRLWVSGKTAVSATSSYGGEGGFRPDGASRGSVTIWEERGGKFIKIADFEEEAIKEAGASWFARWSGQGTNTQGAVFKAVCDPTRGRVYYRGHVFDLTTGKCESRWSAAGSGTDIAFDKRGFMHGYTPPGPGGGAHIWRVDPSGAQKTEPGMRSVDIEKRRLIPLAESAYRKIGGVHYPECPYDYGVQKGKWVGAIPSPGQHGAKGFQDGMGVNMRGEVAFEANISYQPKMGDVELNSGRIQADKHRALARALAERLKKGEQMYFIRQKPGIPLIGATIWVTDSTGELRSQTPAVIGGLMNGLAIDEDRMTYSIMNRTRLVQGEKFLTGMTGRFGIPNAPKRLPFTGTYMKADPENVRVLITGAPVKMDTPPARGLDAVGVSGHWGTSSAWIEGAEWLYAGASSIVPNQPCSCYQMRAHLDWYKRSYMPEQYRYSIGILDTNGNLIMHVGRYANFDSAPGGKDGAKPGGTDIGLTAARYVGGTDDYLTFADFGERLVVLKLDYHAEESAPIR